MRIPGSTYRIQLNGDFTLHAARDIVPYLDDLGITDLYLSPVFEARPGSTHGYDVTDPTRISSALGGESALLELAATARRHGMGLLLDIVPNHMAASPANRWWCDVLRNGRRSPYAHYFDVDFSHGDCVVLPILGDELAAVLARGEITVDAGSGELVYHEHRLPLAESATIREDHAAGDLHELLARQHYELVHWRSADRINYRRFFDITDLVGVRVEDEEVFAATHSLIVRLAADCVITGLRIDHIDGLRDPAGYLVRLRERVRDPEGNPLYTVVEKILQPGERLPLDWACEGTTGYDFLNIATGLLIEPEGFAAIEAFYHRVTGDDRTFDELVREKKLLVIDRLFAGELRILACDLSELTSRAAAECAAAIRGITASLGVYRTYMRAAALDRADRNHIEMALEDAARRDPPARPAMEGLRRVLLLEHPETARALDWVMRWQQFTGPVMAKGFEDTALYCHNALLAANEVGSDPVRPCMTTRELHGALRDRFAHDALSLNATATHDTKRGEDTRARIAVLAEVADEWRARLRRWLREGDRWKAEVEEDDDRIVADADVDNLLYQTIVGAWPRDGYSPDFTRRVQQYMMKAVREAKEQTSWRRPDEDYEQALSAFVARLMGQAGRPGLPEDIATFAERIAPHGALNSLAQLLLKVTAPGIPDFYQGTDLWSLTLVDPDNRSPVDYAERRRILADIAPLLDAPEPARVHELLLDWKDGRVKLLVTAAALRCRNRHRAVFDHGQVLPLAVKGNSAERVLAFTRCLGESMCATIIARGSTDTADGIRQRGDAWGEDTVELPPGPPGWRNVLTGEVVAAGVARLATLFGTLPIALLEPRGQVSG